jgi:haloalkane dehalogenase
MHDISWLDREAYPFTARYFAIDGARMHYVDEGQGQPIVMVHGTPTWSFLYRDMIKQLAPHYRCIAADHLGFGLSDKPKQAAYRPADHARRLAALIEHLGLRDLTLVVHDFGGPIGLSYAIQQPQNIHALVLFNTWMWSLRGEQVAESAGMLGGGRLGKLLFQQLNLEVEVLLKLAWGKKTKLDKAVHQHYREPFRQPRDRHAIQTFARELRDSSPWYEELWRQRERIQNIPALIMWGLKDPVLTVRQLRRWQALLPSAQLLTFPKTGHFVPEEERASLGQLVGQFLLTQRRNDPDSFSNPI